jgi:hypothetical protein
MEHEDLVEASLVGFELGKVICVPAMEDPRLFTEN